MERREDQEIAKADWLPNLLVPEAVEREIRGLVVKNRDLFTQTYAELGHADTISM